MSHHGARDLTVFTLFAMILLVGVAGWADARLNWRDTAIEVQGDRGE
jgi:hypothetical protein